MIPNMGASGQGSICSPCEILLPKGPGFSSAGVYVRARHGDASAFESGCEAAGGLVLVLAMPEEPLVTESFLFFSSFAFAVRKASGGWAGLGCVHV